MIRTTWNRLRATVKSSGQDFDELKRGLSEEKNWSKEKEIKTLIDELIVPIKMQKTIQKNISWAKEKQQQKANNLKKKKLIVVIKDKIMVLIVWH